MKFGLYLFLALTLLGFSLASKANQNFEDLIDITISNGKAIALIEAERSSTIKLRPKEQILWESSKGSIGAVLTTNRFLAISISSSNWHELSVSSNELDNPIVSISQNIAVLVTEDRAIGFVAGLKHFIEKRMPINENVQVVEAGENVAVIVTSSNIFSFAKDPAIFRDIRLHVGEKVERTKVTLNKVTITTSDRLLTFSSKSKSWKEYRL
jgi:phenylalanyl-tRNA synthetase beta subunit